MPAPLFVLEAIRRHAPAVNLEHADVRTVAHDDAAYFYLDVPNRDRIEDGEIYTTYVVHVTQDGIATVSHFRSRKGASVDSTLPPER